MAKRRNVPKPSRAKAPEHFELPVSYKLVFWTMIGMAAVSMGVSVFLVTRPVEEHTDMVKNLVNTCDGTWKLCVGCVIGLLGGKRLP
jgi:hypothetical protein